MAAVTITSSNVTLVSGNALHGQKVDKAAGAGKVVYFDSTTGKWSRAQGDGTEAEAGQYGLGVLLSSTAGDNQITSVAVEGCIVSYGAIFAAGGVYIIGDTPGDIYPFADAGSGDQVTVIGLAISTSQLMIKPIYNAGAVIA